MAMLGAGNRQRATLSGCPSAKFGHRAAGHGRPQPDRPHSKKSGIFFSCATRFDLPPAKSGRGMGRSNPRRLNLACDGQIQSRTKNKNFQSTAMMGWQPRRGSSCDGAGRGGVAVAGDSQGWAAATGND